MKDKEAPKKRKRQVQKSTPMISGHTVYISNLSYLRDRQGIRNLFRPYGEVVFIKIIKGKMVLVLK